MSSTNELSTGGLLYVDPVALKQQLAANWGFLIAVGALNLAGGILALIAPISATVAILSILTMFMIFFGCVNMCGICYLEQPYRVPAFIGGFFIALLGVLMASNVVQSLMVLTILVAITYMLEGLARSTLALLNRDMPGWGATLISGICAILLSIIIIGAFPTSSEYTLGILLGVNWVTYGIQRITLGMMGRATSNEALANAPAANTDGDYVNAP
jgi:uncharacterized membrane protein HdeD (DUF308 family)